MKRWGEERESSVGKEREEAEDIYRIKKDPRDPRGMRCIQERTSRIGLVYLREFTCTCTVRVLSTEDYYYYYVQRILGCDYDVCVYSQIDIYYSRGPMVVPT